MTGRNVLLTGLAGLAALLALGQVHPFGNPWKAEPQSASLLRDAELPAGARAVLVEKCADCHSEASHAPFYASLAPGSWLIERDIVKGRAHLNLSNWQELAPERREVLEEEIIQQASKGKMPPLQYRLLHWNAKLSAEDVHALGMLQKNAEDRDNNAQPAGDAARGMMVFEKRCVGCHAMDADREGPQLRGVYGRKAGSVAGFQYSASLAHLGLTWNSKTLEQWLADPDAMVPGNNMSFATPKAQDRKDLIAYFQQLSDK